MLLTGVLLAAGASASSTLMLRIRRGIAAGRVEDVLDFVDADDPLLIHSPHGARLGGLVFLALAAGLPPDAGAIVRRRTLLLGSAVGGAAAVGHLATEAARGRALAVAGLSGSASLRDQVFGILDYSVKCRVTEPVVRWLPLLLRCIWAIASKVGVWAIGGLDPFLGLVPGPDT